MISNELLTDYELTNMLRNDNLAAFDIVFKKYGNRLFGFAIKYLRSKEETEELVQGVFIKLWENRKKIKKGSSLKSYLFTIAYHDLCKIFRQKQIHEKFVKNIAEQSEETLDLEKQLQYRFTLEEVDKLIEKLPEKQKLIWIKSRKEGKSTKEIALEMNLAPGTIDNLISSAGKFLRKQLSEDNFALLLFFTLFFK